MPVDGACEKYKICENGKYKTYECEPGLLYNDKFRSCVEPENSDCPEAINFPSINAGDPKTQNEFAVRIGAIETAEVSENEDVVDIPPAHHTSCARGVPKPCKKVNINWTKMLSVCNINTFDINITFSSK